MSNLVPALAQAIVAFISATGYLAVLLLMAIESACIPLPSEIIMPFAGYLVSTGRLNLFLVATAGALGCNLGSAVAYLIGARGGRPAIARWGALVLIGPQELAWAERFFERFGSAAVFVGRLLPVVRTFIALPAGLALMPQLRFHIYTFAGSWIWCLALAYLGAKLGEQWDSNPTLRAAFHSLDAVIVVVLALGVVAFVWHRIASRRVRG
jgi:membrane protein DedA with SNARE-associated domain